MNFEDVEEWYCSKCKTHTVGSKKLDIWRPPSILIVMFKRFIQHHYGCSKQTTNVLFPLFYELESQHSMKKDRYELTAIGNHYGNMETGHCKELDWDIDTAYCKRNGKWYHFDDDTVTPIKESELQSSWAYVLFYEQVPSSE